MIYKQKEIERKYERALQVVKLLWPNERVPEGYKGAISSFGADLAIKGLLPTLKIYNEKGNKEVDPKEIIDAIYLIMDSTAPMAEVKVAENEMHPLLKKALRLHGQIMPTYLLMNDISIAAIALKHCIRTLEYISKSKTDGTHK